MLKIQSDRVIIDGHEPTKEQCETMTLLANALAESNNFKTVDYRDGYAEFEKVGKADELKFKPMTSDITIIFDSNITSVSCKDAYGIDLVWSSSGETHAVSGGSYITFTVLCKEGYELSSVMKDGSEVIISNNTFTVLTDVASTITLTSKQSTPKVSVDLTTLPGWASLSTGTHNIAVVAKAYGYRDSEPSAAVSVTKYQQLTAPVISLSGNILTWSAVPNASSYKLYADNTDKGTVTSGIDLTTLQLAVGTHSIQVIAVGSGYYTDSDKSNSVSYTVQPAQGGYTVSITYTNIQKVDGLVTINGDIEIFLNQYGTHTVQYSDVQTFELHSMLAINVLSATGSLVGYEQWTTVNITQDSSIAVEFYD